MDKNRKFSAQITKEAELQVHRYSPYVVVRPVHRNYGLHIFHAFAGLCSRQTGDRDRRRYFEFYSIAHLYKGHGCYYRPDLGYVPVEPGQCILVSPRTVQNYYGDRALFCEDTVNFSGPLADALFRSGIFADGVFELGMSRRLLPIIELADDPSDHAQINANFELQKLIVDIYNRRFLRQAKDRYPEITELTQMLREHPERWWSIAEMADFCNMSDDQFRRIFRRRVGMLPKQYVDQLKLRHAASLLSDSRLSIAEVAERTGYRDEFHFRRRFKRIIGVSPGQYRGSLPK